MLDIVLGVLTIARHVLLDSKVSVLAIIPLWFAVCLLISLASGLAADVAFSSFVYLSFPVFLGICSDNKHFNKTLFLYVTLLSVVFNCLFGTIWKS